MWKQLTERRTEEAKQLRRLGVVKDTRSLKVLVPREDGLANTITATAHDKNRLLAWVTRKSTSMRSRYTKSDSLNTKTMETSQKSNQTNCPISTYWSEDFRARLSRLLVKGKVSKIRAVRSFLTSHAFSEVKNQGLSYWRTSKDCYLMTMATLSKPLSPRLQNWGTTFSGRCLTQRISESHRIGSACSLLDILEEQPDQKYFLSPKTTARILSYQPSRHELPLTQTELMLVKDRHVKS